MFTNRCVFTNRYLIQTMPLLVKGLLERDENYGMTSGEVQKQAMQEHFSVWSRFTSLHNFGIDNIASCVWTILSIVLIYLVTVYFIVEVVLKLLT